MTLHRFGSQRCRLQNLDLCTSSREVRKKRRGGEGKKVQKDSDREREREMVAEERYAL